MPKSDMHQAYMRSLMYLVAGPPPARGLDRWFEKLHKLTGPDPRSRIGIRSLQAAYSGQWISKHKYASDRTWRIMERIAANARKTDDITQSIEQQLAIWNEAPELFATRIAIVSRCLEDLRRENADEVGAAGGDADAVPAAPAA